LKIHLHNTLTRRKEEFLPIDASNVRMYVCGPTVYDRAHIGNARAAVVFDLLFRILREIYGDNRVTYVRNITDVDDKIINAAAKNNENISELTERTTRFFHDDMAALNCLFPTHEPRATAHINEMLEMMQGLIANNHAYEVDGHVLFSVNSYADYGKLSRRNRDEMIAGARVEIAPYKKDAADFVLWKPAERNEQGFDSQFGRGRPGWHIECSAMSRKYLGDTFDIHGGGADLMFPHHENEIAQSTCFKPDSKFAKTWVHNGFLTVNGEKMSKSLGNFITVNDLLNAPETNDGDVIRYALLSTQYSKPLDWNNKAYLDAKSAMGKFRSALARTAFIGADYKPNAAVINALCDDMNTPKALAELHSMVREINKESNASKLEHLCGELAASLSVMGLYGSNTKLHSRVNSEEMPAELSALVIARGEAKKAKNFALADAIRAQITALGYSITDKADGAVDWKLLD